MPIRVEHGPSMIPVGQLAFQTGQLQYRNKRRTELERLAMQQAEMRQRAKMQQQQIASSLRGQQMSQMGAMQRLAMGQQFGQVNAQQANQWQVQAAEQRREHEGNLAEQVGQRAVDRVKLGQGLADDAAWKKAEWSWLVDTYDKDLNSAGQQHVQGLLTDRMRIQQDQRIREDDRPAALEANMGQIKEAQSNPQFRIGRDQEPGSREPFLMNKDGNHIYTRIRVANNGNDADFRFEPNRKRSIKDPDNIWTGGTGMIDGEISETEWFAENTKKFETDGVQWIEYPDGAGGMVREQYEGDAQTRRDHNIEVGKLWQSMDEIERLDLYPGGYDQFKLGHPFDVTSDAQPAVPRVEPPPAAPAPVAPAPPAPAAPAPAPAAPVQPAPEIDVTQPMGHERNPHIAFTDQELQQMLSSGQIQPGQWYKTPNMPVAMKAE